MYKIVNSLIPVLNHQRFALNSKIHGHDTRQRDNIHPSICRTTMRQNTVCFQRPKLWNHLPEQLKSARTVYAFKKCLKLSLIFSLC